MSSMSPSDIREFVRTHLDVDAEELPSTLLDLWMQDGYNRIVSWNDSSPAWLEVEYQFDTAIGQQSYDLDTTVGLTAPSALQHVLEVRGPWYSLSPRDHRQARAMHRVDAPTGRPQDFTLWGRTLYLWPTPAAVETYYVLGSRKPLDWLSTNSAPDCPEEFHRLIAQWALSRAYAQQDDIEMSTLYRDEFATEVANLSRKYTQGLVAQPLVLNGGQNREQYRTARTLGPLIYTWE